ncbi:hypothetical protein [Campylobacter helveticus]
MLCDQIRCVSIERFKNKIAVLEPKKQKELKEILRQMFE